MYIQGKLRRIAHPKLSIVIPTYNESQRLPPSLAKIHAFLEEREWLGTTEIVVADDGSQDGTPLIVTRLIPHWPGISVLLLPHAGKGAALRQGALAARGEQIFLCDADLSMPIEEITRFLEPPYQEYDIAIASREIEGAHRFDEPQVRHVMGRVFNWLVRAMAVSGIDDTQCGFKRLTRVAAHDLFSKMMLSGWGYDVELLALAQRRGYRIAEVPIHWFYGRDSRVRPLRDTIRMVGEVWQVRRRLRLFEPLDVEPELESFLARRATLRKASRALLDQSAPAPVTAGEQAHDLFH